MLSKVYFVARIRKRPDRTTNEETTRQDDKEDMTRQDDRNFAKSGS